MSPLPRVIFVCGREVDYVRNKMIWDTIQSEFDGTLVALPASRSLTLRQARLLPPLMRALRQPHDLLVVGFYAHPLMLAARRLTHAPILFDPFVSTYDTVVQDRGFTGPGSPMAGMLQRLDRSALAAADAILTDTHAHATYYHTAFNAPWTKLHTLYLGCDTQTFQPQPRVYESSDQGMIVFTYSTYLPLHGMETIVRAAKLCEGYPIQFRLVGSRGPTYRAVRSLAESNKATNVTFAPTVPFADLPGEIAQSDVCLGGHFGASEKAQRVIAGKTYQFIAMHKPVILADNAANRELFTPGETAYFCAPDDPEALADAIFELYQRPGLRRTLADNSLYLAQERLPWERLHIRLLNLMRRML